MGSELTVFQEMKVGPALEARILELDPGFAARGAEEQKEVVGFLMEQAKATTEGVKTRLPTIAIKHAGASSFEMPKTAGAEHGDLVREFEGVILHQGMAKSYWKKSLDDGGSTGPPDCASVDGLTPYSKEPVSQSCAACPLNKFGSAENGRGKACRDSKRLVVHLDGHDLPARMSISASNIKKIDGYMNDLRDQGRVLGTVRTKFKAFADQSPSGVEFTGLDISTCAVLDMDETLRIKRDVVDVFRGDFRSGSIEPDAESTTGAAPAELPEKATSVM